MSETRRWVGYRRVLPTFGPLSESVLIDGEICDRRTGKPWRSIEMVYEGDPGWEEVEGAQKAAAKESEEYERRS